MSIFSRKPTTEPAVDVFDAPTTAVDDLTGSYTIDPSHSRIGFSARHAMVTTVRGSFRDFTGTATIDAADPAASSVSLTIKTASIDTGNADRDGHLVSADFFDAEVNPEITFVSTAVAKVDEDTWAITGDLSIAGTTKSLTIAFDETGSAQDPFGNLRAGFEGSTALNRKDWGLTWNAALETGGLLVSEKIKLELDISAIKNA
ncbi:polyisoprenoid-binding protein [Nocardioides sp. dk4132]|uniref:YceI family protein n=1 Tax=unclassified Nocardioides TaxID=2615069 RepID=UPI0012953DE0|nr:MULTISPECIES: YceI family protein [unclassified Nocardioides]MQW76990.1 polyisoprenoid-binding protein [Nocardioides sp. dk4132]QGA09404.1 polyisoprenoid-binding protein [Nocardioides sp. dk884]